MHAGDFQCRLLLLLLSCGTVNSLTSVVLLRTSERETLEVLDTLF